MAQGCHCTYPASLHPCIPVPRGHLYPTARLAQSPGLATIHNNLPRYWAESLHRLASNGRPRTADAENARSPAWAWAEHSFWRLAEHEDIARSVGYSTSPPVLQSWPPGR
ncbi:hypothetical protein PC9H_009116 [Pleurotus ostreatus]|uniref:Uncharacterized protein n=2 Tax=Pleurotus ostreatus TaxID=5322 RepID=A0A067ND26_PLEO1|nr:uncharacterized protein PC9H_009116 [Pleurotus ostreatus]KAF7426747.1 hypothetical protein PC9H_009116 [Pleurotus ostreatus]KDQ22032.1 hypothetical protein PLEOSDRAFT_1110146 [Pleurotus ostreatus PC15]